MKYTRNATIDRSLRSADVVREMDLGEVGLDGLCADAIVSWGRQVFGRGHEAFGRILSELALAFAP